MKIMKQLYIVMALMVTGSVLAGCSPHWKHSELMFEKKGLIPALQKLITEQIGR